MERTCTINARNGTCFGDKIKNAGYEQWRKVFVLLCCAMAALFFMPTFDVAVSYSSELSLSLPISTMNVISFGDVAAGVGAPATATAPAPAAEPPAFCGECGTPIKPGSAFCPGYGRRLS